MTCKECIHNDICEKLRPIECCMDITCSHFKNKANFVELPCPCDVGNTVYVTVNCSRIMKFYDNDYLTGTGSIECPFENVCKFTECNDENIQVLETCVSYLLCDDDGWSFGCEHINRNYNLDDIGKTVFLTKEEAEQKLKGGAEQ